MAIAVFGFVLLLPILLLLLVATIVAMIVFATLSFAAWVGGRFRGLSGKDPEGRRNVRIRQQNLEDQG